MLRTSRTLFVLATLATALPAAGQESEPESATPPPSGDTPARSEASEAESDKPSTSDDKGESEKSESAASGARVEAVDAAAAPPPEPAAKPTEESSGFRTFVSGYFRAPFAMGLSPRRDPGDQTGPSRMQVSYAPTRVLDASYYSFAYTRLQELDWAEVFFHAKKKHVEAVVGWMGYWFASAGFRNPDAAWAPGMAYLTLDTDVPLGSIKPNVALTAGAFWPQFGYHEKYDTLTLGRFRFVGEQLKFTVPVTPDVTITASQGFGTNRDGSFNIQFPAPHQSVVGLDLLHYEHVKVAYKDYVDVGIHFNHQWTRDPNLTQQGSPGQAYPDARAAKFTTAGAEINVRAPYAGHLWVSPSFTRIRNGWALAQGGTEMMHSLGGSGYASNYMGWEDNADLSTGTGSSLNVGFLYENSLSTILGKQRGEVVPEVTLSAFGLFIDANLNLPKGSLLPQDHLGQMKYGADVTVHPLTWMSVMLRWDEVNYNLDDTGYVFSAITPRLTFQSHFLSSESIYIQYSRYRYGDRMVVVPKWPWGQYMIPGTRYTQAGPYAGEKPDMDVIKVQASVTF
jgi:hypothetical protein